MPEPYTVAAGDCLSTIAEDFGFSDYRSIYDDPINADFRKLRPNPNLIYPGDVINIPDKEGKFDDKSTEQTHDYQVRASKRYLRLRLKHQDGQLLTNAPYTLKVDGQARNGQTDGQGMLREKISRTAREATLDIAGVNWKLDIAHLNPIQDTPDDGTLGIQQRLSNLGYDPGPIDGIYGPLTEAAVRAFQEDNPPLDVDGICGPKTTAQLVEEHGS